MNLSNELDLAMDDAVKEHLRHLFATYFQSRATDESKLTDLKTAMDQLEQDIDAAQKALGER